MCSNMKGESSKILGRSNTFLPNYPAECTHVFGFLFPLFGCLGTIGDYEIGAKWQWRIQLQTVTLFVLGASVLSLLLVAIGFTYIWTELAKVTKTQAELVQLKDDILQLQTSLELELLEVQKFKEEFRLEDVYWKMDQIPVNRTKRSDREEPKEFNSVSKSKQKAYPKELKRIGSKSQKHDRYRSTSHGIQYTNQGVCLLVV